ncbi:high-affinity glutamine permease [Spathaspora passalidarum NRRL Y-27907]|uniref:High-affinity glutamine permease n=1 Tax=Spathaspora passalidarum (strain NRRL Y-27907 / 11-Y1) TaxID=619300 RepID=G3ATQ4_SPAPN|nr:high-affinity glutamine permease [Spathaspora passalidarum NRRL Y-27907]EGW30280.1 high-affinity glutamine permease [Spathaspora passalidarum NRRL Y-27907]
MTSTTTTVDEELSGWKKFKHSFKRQTTDDIAAGKQLAKGISKRHLILMALVTGIGTGLLVGSGQVLHKAGPLFVLIGWAIVGSFVYPTLQAAGEMAVNYSELSGGYNNYPRRFIDESLAFAITWNYCIQWLSVIAIELVTAAITIQYWNTSVNPDVWVTIFYIVVLVINFFGAKGYGEGEFVLGSCKIIMVVGFIIMGIVVNVGGGPEGEYIGGRYWHDPGFATNFKGLCSVFVTGAFSLGQSEFVALTAAEQSNPRRAIPTACKLIIWRVIVLFLGSLTIVGLLVPYNSDRLMGSQGGGSHASPFVLAAALHGVRAVPSIINAVILLSVTSVASSSLYSASRTLQSLAEQGFAPSWLNYIDNDGRPLRSLIVCSICGLFSFIAAYKNEEAVFNWLLAISGLSQIFTWFGICLSHVRFRAALAYNNISLESLGYVSPTGVWGSYYAIIWYILVLIAQFWIALYPVGYGTPQVESFFQNYLGALVLIVFYFGHKLWTRNWKLWYKLEDIDINLDRTIFDEEILKLEREEEKEKWNRTAWYMKALKFMFV